MPKQSTPLKSLIIAIGASGGQSALARACDVSQAAVWRWLHIVGKIPAEHVLKVEELTGVSRHDLRPDIYPREVMADERRFVGIDLRASSRADRLALGERYAKTI